MKYFLTKTTQTSKIKKIFSKSYSNRRSKIRYEKLETPNWEEIDHFDILKTYLGEESANVLTSEKMMFVTPAFANRLLEEAKFPLALATLGEAKSSEFVLEICETVFRKSSNTSVPPTVLKMYLVASDVVKKSKRRQNGEENETTMDDERGTSEQPLYVITTSKGAWIGIILNVAIMGVFIFLIYSMWNQSNPLKDVMDTSYSVITEVDTLFDDVIGNEEAKEDLSSIVEYLRDPEKFENIKTPKGVLMVGPPGTGKTLMARALAGEADVPFYSVSGSEFEEVFVGLGAKRIRGLFEEAKKNAPCIIFIDEIDALGGNRANKFQRNNMSLNQLLVELDGFDSSDGVIVIGATNIPEMLDPALVRSGRFDRKVVMDLPSRGERQRMLDYFLNKIEHEPIDTNMVASQTPGFSGADLESMINWASIDALKIHVLVNMDIVENAMWNIAMGRERKSVIMNDEEKRLTAYHESGHALVALYTEGSDEIRKATLVPRGQALGMVNFLPNEEYTRTKQQMVAQIDVSMGGRAAEEMIFGKDYITTGASSDLQGATKTAQNIVTKFGMSPDIGLVYVSADDLKHSSHETLSAIESEVKSMLGDSYKRACTILTQNEKELHALANALLLYETLTREEIMIVIKGGKLDRDTKKL